MSTVDDLIAGLSSVKRRATSVRICTRADLGDEHARLNERLKQARARGARTLGEASEEADLAEQVLALEDEMASASLDVTVYALDTHVWNRLIAKYPKPDEPSPLDEATGVDYLRFMGETVPKCLVDPDGDPVTDEKLARLAELVERQNPADQERLCLAVWAVNRGEDDPKSQLASRVIALRDAASKLQPGSASPLESSTDGSPESSTVTTTETATLLG